MSYKRKNVDCPIVLFDFVYGFCENIVNERTNDIALLQHNRV